MDKIIERPTVAPPPPPRETARYDDRDAHGGPHKNRPSKKKRREGFLSELFDF